MTAELTLSGNVTCDHLSTNHPDVGVLVDVSAVFDIDDTKNLKLGSKGKCSTRGCGHNCGTVQVTCMDSMFWSIGPELAKKDDQPCLSPVIVETP